MQQPPASDDEQAAEALARARAAAASLGLETAWLEAAGTRVGAGRYLRTWVDTDNPRLAIRFASEGALAARPARARYVELDSIRGEYELAVGSRRFSEDRAVITAVPAPALDALEKIFVLLGGGRCDALGRLSGSTTGWTLALVEAPGGNLELSAAKLGAHAHRLGVPQPQTTLMQQAHAALGGNGFSVTFTCDRTGLRRDLTLEYREVPWNHVVALNDALRPGTSAEVALGVFASAMGSGETASALSVAYRAGKTAGIRVAVDHGDLAFAP